MEAPINYPKVGRLYKHYKGGTYKVLFMTKHSETDELLVIYQSQEYGSYHSRPLVMWFENMNKDDNDIHTDFIKIIYRFKLIEDQKE